jgi:DNA repair protein MmcB-like
VSLLPEEWINKMTRKIKSLSGFTSDQIIAMLGQHHNKDVFVPQCKNGQTWYNNHLLKLDAWVLKKTYSPLTTVGYEIKVSRHDFEQDQKWIDYVSYCHEFYFVCPAGLIRSDELPQGVGLMWVSTTGKLHIKRKTDRREPDPEKLNSLLIYILMSRSIIVADMNKANTEVSQEENRLQALRTIVEEAEAKKELGYFIKGHVRKMQEYFQEQNSLLKGREDKIERFTKDLARLGITWNPETSDWQDTYRVENEIALLKNQISPQLIYEMRNAGNNLIEVASKIQEYRDKQETTAVINKKITLED